MTALSAASDLAAASSAASDASIVLAEGPIGGAAEAADSSTTVLIDQSAKPAGIAYDGTVYRLEDPARVSTTFDAHAGNVAADHRYSAPGTGTVYGATSAETALAEVDHYGLSDGRISVTSDVSLKNVLDLTNPATLKALNVTTAQITGDSYAVTQKIGDFARANGYDGILAPSARNAGGTNLIIIPKGK